ncbi:MAG: hypothetical protein A2487_00035 [Candidatus Raymondbacteria bacterium RifOxyC12_full_50_8]|uniref:Uncharacterized protein n=1 Tax=Candidatus Raymondbacteria bacterium RIFOXYD12_FULL_49_13 TaxID=1817890 RepID=A0A1F7F7F2_UNCRA|nr:MAG: hypothetical protein A2248_21970 [Candidatus Raymondbacteria bacterium RIFOXYA2_FULL_49_16]OGJ88426.1 MAG: hypothetical protein A2350_11310 [Candidatus Raymondbacteria bacterium RifOxyB12_full_50_8]OGJ96285.1 MAG: hypothetical protein A2453_08840 [Candidatus Raymondbacteria bacterium RIFOXYC2_FULL_50_21]OGK02492.1 MAG: hypothetical protein A2519_12185 [Candidatus Raymondbacteria bacterium RIFOXYD12_FULL_49_13]OGK03136.1 MAG: hypothetical protein A2487_00035 [Candidatus Raymondbacteria b
MNTRIEATKQAEVDEFIGLLVNASANPDKVMALVQRQYGLSREAILEKIDKAQQVKGAADLEKVRSFISNTD